MPADHVQRIRLFGGERQPSSCLLFSDHVACMLSFHFYVLTHCSAKMPACSEVFNFTVALQPEGSNAPVLASITTRCRSFGATVRLRGVASCVVPDNSRCVWSVSCKLARTRHDSGVEHLSDSSYLHIPMFGNGLSRQKLSLHAVEMKLHSSKEVRPKGRAADRGFLVAYPDFDGAPVLSGRHKAGVEMCPGRATSYAYAPWHSCGSSRHASRF